MRFDAVPTTGVNEVKFGMNREEVRSFLYNSNIRNSEKEG